MAGFGCPTKYCFMFESLGFNVGEHLYFDILGYDTVHVVIRVSVGSTSSIIIPINRE
jgi:hypothetical protein